MSAEKSDRKSEREKVSGRLGSKQKTLTGGESGLTRTGAVKSRSPKCPMALVGSAQAELSQVRQSIPNSHMKPGRPRTRIGTQRTNVLLPSETFSLAPLLPGPD